MGTANTAMPAMQQAAQQLPRQQGFIGNVTGIAPPNGTTNPFQTPSQGAKGGPPPSPQMLASGLQQTAQRQLPMTMQRQPQGGMAGANTENFTQQMVRNALRRPDGMG